MAEKAQDPAAAKRAAVAMYGKLPLSFEPTESAARFLARSGNYTVSVGGRESSVSVTAQSLARARRSASRLRMQIQPRRCRPSSSRPA